MDEVIAEFAQEYRISLILALTANHALSETAAHWQESKKPDRTTGDHLDLTTICFLCAATDRTIAMSTLASASTADPLMMTPKNPATSIQIMMTGGTPPPIPVGVYTMVHQHLCSLGRHSPRSTGHRTRHRQRREPLGENDIPSEFFNEVRQIRHDISHKRGVCVESAGNTIIDWVEPEKRSLTRPGGCSDCSTSSPTTNCDALPHEACERTASCRTNSLPNGSKQSKLVSRPSNPSRKNGPPFSNSSSTTQ